MAATLNPSSPEFALDQSSSASQSKLNPNASEFKLVVNDSVPKSELNPLASEFKVRLPSAFNPEASPFVPLAEPSLRADAAEFHPTGAGEEWLHLQHADVFGRKPKHREIPPATEAEWELRIAKREKEVETIKSLPSYKLYCDILPPDLRGDGDPKTPDPRDRNVSKRMWKWTVERWRLELKARRTYTTSVMLQCREYALRMEAEGRSWDGVDGTKLVRGTLKAMPASISLSTAVPVLSEPPGLTLSKKSRHHGKFS